MTNITEIITLVRMGLSKARTTTGDAERATVLCDVLYKAGSVCANRLDANRSTVDALRQDVAEFRAVLRNDASEVAIYLVAIANNRQQAVEVVSAFSELRDMVAQLKTLETVAA